MTNRNLVNLLFNQGFGMHEDICRDLGRSAFPCCHLFIIFSRFFALSQESKYERSTSEGRNFVLVGKKNLSLSLYKTYEFSN